MKQVIFTKVDDIFTFNYDVSDGENIVATIRQADEPQFHFVVRLTTENIELNFPDFLSSMQFLTCQLFI